MRTHLLWDYEHAVARVAPEVLVAADRSIVLAFRCVEPDPDPGFLAFLVVAVEEHGAFARVALDPDPGADVGFGGADLVDGVLRLQDHSELPRVAEIVAVVPGNSNSNSNIPAATVQTGNKEGQWGHPNKGKH